MGATRTCALMASASTPAGPGSGFADGAGADGELSESLAIKDDKISCSRPSKSGTGLSITWDGSSTGCGVAGQGGAM